MPTVVNTVSPFVIKELSGDGRELRLVGRGLPYRPFTLKTVQRMETTWYPGNPEATATLLGAAEDPTTIQGAWKDKFISQEVEVTDISNGTPTPNVTYPITLDGEPVDTVRFAVFVVDDIIRKGQLLEVTWDEQTRHGHLKEFEKSWQNIHDLEWTMTFEWISRGEPTGPSVVTTETSVGDTATTLEEQNRQLQEAAEPSFPVSNDFSSALSDRLDTINTSVNSARNTSSSLARLAVSPFEAARRTVAVCSALISECSALAEFMEENVFISVNTVRPIDQLTFGERIAAAKYAKGVVSLARVLRRTAIIRRSVIASQIENQLLGIYTARDGDDLRSVSQQYYSTPFEWRRLMLFNQLPSPQLYAGQLILVPKINSGDRSF